MVIFYKKWKSTMNNRIIKNHPPSPAHISIGGIMSTSVFCGKERTENNCNVYRYCRKLLQTAMDYGVKYRRPYWLAVTLHTCLVNKLSSDMWVGINAPQQKSLPRLRFKPINGLLVERCYPLQQAQIIAKSSRTITVCIGNNLKGAVQYD